VIEWGPPRSIKGKECHRSSRRKTFATINSAFIPPPFCSLYARSNLIAVVCKWPPRLSLISSQGLDNPNPKRKEKQNKKIQDNIDWFLFFAFQKHLMSKIYLKKNKWREIRDDRIFIFTYNQTWIAAATLLLLFLPSEKKEEDIDMDMHIPRHPSLRVYQWVEPLYNRTILYSVCTYIYMVPGSFIRSQLRGLVDQKVAHPKNSFLTTAVFKLKIFR
jgi:hypothetical protein